mgnify:CR=1 FL=1
MNCIKTVFAGDLFCDNDSFEISNKVVDFFKEHDLRCGNLEGTIDFDDKKNILKVGPILKQNEKVLSLIKKLKINYLNLANNHILDNGYESCEKTIRLLGRIKLLGFGDRKNAYKLHVFKKYNIKIGLLSFSEWSFSTLVKENKCGSAWINDSYVNLLISEAKKKVDFLIINIHAGAENLCVPLPEWKEKYKEIINLGADIIVGHHPHVIQGFEKYKKGLIFYSLGNFYFGKNDISNGLLLSIKFYKKKFIFRTKIIKKENNIILLEKENNKKLEKLNSLIKGKKYYQIVKKYCKNNWKNQIKRYIEFFVIGVYIKNIFLIIVKRIFDWIMGKKFNRIKNLYLVHSIMNETNRFIIYRAIFIKK